MLVPFGDVLAEATARRGAAGAFTCYDLQQLRAVLDVAARRDRAVIILVAPKVFRQAGGDVLVAAFVAAASRSPARACLQLDHVSEVDAIEAAFQLGVGAAMADGAHLAFDDNLAFLSRCAALAERYGTALEAELGQIAGDEDVAAAVAAGALTDPEEARRLVAVCRVACLAVSIGNVHGTYRRPPVLDLELLTRVAESVDVPLSLHGASGVPERQVRSCIGRGIRKVNVNTELRRTYLEATREVIRTESQGANLLALHGAQRRAVEEAVGACLAAYEVDSPTSAAAQAP